MHTTTVFLVAYYYSSSYKESKKMLLSAFLITVASSPRGATHQLDSGIFTVESSLWAQEARCQSGDPITLHVNMVVAEKLQLESVFWAVSDPDNERYGKHLSMEELTKLVGSDAADLDIVASWLKGAGATEISISQTKVGARKVERKWMKRNVACDCRQCRQHCFTRTCPVFPSYLESTVHGWAPCVCGTALTAPVKIVGCAVSVC